MRKLQTIGGRKSNPTSRPGRSRVGFTLVELLVVIGIIALLISILLPAINRARKQAQTVKCLSNLRQMALGMTMTAVERKGYMQPTSEKALVEKVDSTRSRFSWTSDASGQFPRDWASALLPYFGDRSGQTFIENKNKSAVFQCPSDPSLDLQNPGYSMLVNFSWAYAPNSYGVNADISSLVDPANNAGYFNGGFLIGVYGGPRNYLAYPVGVGSPLGAKLSEVFKSSETMLVADCGVRPAVDGAGVTVANLTTRSNNGLDYSDVLAYSTNYIVGNSGAFPGNEKALMGTLEGVARTNWLKRKIPYERHGKGRDEKDGRINVAFADGHVETVGRADFKRVRVSPYKFDQ